MNGPVFLRESLRSTVETVIEDAYGMVNAALRADLLDGNDLTGLMVEHDVGVRSSRVLEFKRLDEDFFSEE
ncbi:MAG: hypothetical protein R3C70_15705 [Geminicoccaceae bacterium]